MWPLLGRSLRWTLTPWDDWTQEKERVTCQTSSFSYISVSFRHPLLFCFLFPYVLLFSSRSHLTSTSPAIPSCQIYVIHPGPPPFILSLYPLSHSPLSAPASPAGSRDSSRSLEGVGGGGWEGEGGPGRRGPAPRACVNVGVAVTRRRRREGGERTAGAAGLVRALALPAARRGAGRAQAAAGGMESLLENPVRAVLYLKELTAIVQNQQSLIHTQRQRIDELERRLDELSAENRSLWEHQQLLQAQPPPGLVPPSPATAGAQEPLQDHGQLPTAAPQPAPEQPPLQHHGQLLAQPQPGPSGRAHAPQSPHQHPVAPGAVADKEKERPPSCCAAAGTLLQHKSPAALGKGVLSRRPE